MFQVLGFKGEYRFLSNFWMAPITVGKLTFPTSEHAYQAAKSLDPADWQLVLADSQPGRAKHAGRKITLRPDWESIKLEVMAEITAAKYDQHPDLKAKLMATGSWRLVEDNTWGDTFWGICRGVGTNHLGQILMAYRDQ